MEKVLEMKKERKQRRTGATAGLIYKYIIDILRVVVIVVTIIAINKLSNNLARYVLEKMTFSSLKLCFFASFMTILAFAIVKVYTDFKKIKK